VICFAINDFIFRKVCACAVSRADVVVDGVPEKKQKRGNPIVRAAR